MDHETQRRVRVLRRHLAAACDELDVMLEPAQGSSVPVHAVVSEATLRRLQTAAKEAGFLGGSTFLYLNQLLARVSKKGQSDDEEQD